MRKIDPDEIAEKEVSASMDRLGRSGGDPVVFRFFMR